MSAFCVSGVEVSVGISGEGEDDGVGCVLAALVHGDDRAFWLVHILMYST